MLQNSLCSSGVSAAGDLRFCVHDSLPRGNFRQRKIWFTGYRHMLITFIKSYSPFSSRLTALFSHDEWLSLFIARFWQSPPKWCTYSAVWLFMARTVLCTSCNHPVCLSVTTCTQTYSLHAYVASTSNPYRHHTNHSHKPPLVRYRGCRN